MIYGQGRGKITEEHLEQAKSRFAKLESALKTATGQEQRFQIHNLKLFLLQVALLREHVPVALQHEVQGLYLRAKAEAGKHGGKKR